MHIVYSILFLLASFMFVWCGFNILLSVGAIAHKEPVRSQVRGLMINIFVASTSFTGMMAYLFIW